MVVNLYIK